MVMEEMNPPRDTHILIRGQYDHPGEKVSPGIPACLPPLAAGLPNNRLGFARWLVDPANPLTGRVAVNRQWQMFFGQGLVRTTEDFGSQGDRPSHPELLDWLATEFVRRGWDGKALDRLIVTSATYRQSSNATRQQIEQRSGKPASGPRPAETALGGNDPRPGAGRQRPARRTGRRPFGAALSAAGTVERFERPDLQARFGTGPLSPQPLHVLEADGRPAGDGRLRRLDPRDVHRPRNADQHAAAGAQPAQRRHLHRSVPQAGRARARDPASSPSERIERAFRLVLSRRPTAAEVRILRRSYDRRLAAFRADPDSARKLLAVGQSPRDDRLDAAELAAYTTTASLIFNLAETVTKE